MNEYVNGVSFLYGNRQLFPLPLPLHKFVTVYKKRFLIYG